ncbi:kinase-like domain-containing protein [Trichoderma chlorosporum]
MTSTARQDILHSPGLQVSIDFNTLKFLAPGTSAAVYAIDDERVLKEYHDPDCGTVELQALERLDSHPNIIRYFGKADDKSIVLERGQPLATQGQTVSAPIKTKLAWIRDAATGLQYIHKQGIIHADFGCENMVLVKDRLKIIDFEGCSIDGQEAASGYKWYNCQGSIINEQSDIFAYGCVVYQILTGRPTYYEYEASKDRSKLVRQLYAENRFPEVQDLPLGDFMTGCWSGSFSSMDEVISALIKSLNKT